MLDQYFINQPLSDRLKILKINVSLFHMFKQKNHYIIDNFNHSVR